jgi:beta-N-acetylhexosaminidase
LKKVFFTHSILFFFFVFFPADIHSLSFFNTGPSVEIAKRLVEGMNDEQLLAQTLMLGWVGSEPSPIIMDWIRERNIGGVKIFGWNTQDTLKLAETVGKLQKNALEHGFGIPLFVATDQEGGLVRHVKGSTRETPGNMAIGASGRPRDAYWSGYFIGMEIALLGINMNFAPGVDLYTNYDSVLIGPRSFGSDPVKSGILGAAFMRGQEAAGIISTAKHYPGHGDTELDSHGVLPRINVPFDMLWERELVPYRMLAKEGVPAVMTGHLAFPKTQAGETPASLSPWFIRDVLRSMMKFRGLVITDDLMMYGAINYTRSLPLAAYQALMAGNDIIMFSQTPGFYSSLWNLLMEKMKDEVEFRNRVTDAAFRIIQTKLEFFRRENSVPFIPDLKKVENGLQGSEGNAFFLGLAARSVTVVKGTFPLEAEKAGRVLLAGQYQEFFNAGKKAFPNAQTYTYGSSQAELLRVAANADTIIFCLSDEMGLRTLRSLMGSGKKVIVLSVLSPAYLSGLNWIDGAVAVYSYAPESFIAGFSAMMGRIPAEGRIPF